MDDSLHCNWLKCRKSLVLEGKAVVTTCSHIFCVSCAESLFTADKACPACKTVLDQPDDVVLSSLNPSVDYRTSVLAGLAPDVIIDIAGRSLGFWTYQQSQEKILFAAVTERNTLLEKRIQSILVEANGEINLLQQKLANFDKDLSGERRRSRELQEALRAATKDYERLKLRLQQDQRRKSSGGAHTAPAPTMPQQGLDSRSADSTNNFWQSNPRAFIPPSPTMTPKTMNAGGMARDDSSTNPLFNQTSVPSSQHDRFRPALGKSGAGEQGIILPGNGVLRSPTGAGGGNSQRQSVFGQLASPSLGHLQHAGRANGADIARAGSKIPEVSTASHSALQRYTR
ncbi:hypothetical protein BCV69DRAFT_201803 [Microstroma glucosiphilum]|uniref:RING-type domain-containing protein n=1 Tax=Pseudomicrostroma glucosiphilum TaxID=1684307 RepID=A0A316U5R8_9BASI|nr:hypothetical protein BCV69DRAFT_201803 [Pseudomicrostroma glucosiphilum]PWN20184.1 hypothetical protein BCV69DRAFT_201803 [Pseudomicrostroma glucosiphilum]